MKEKILLFGGSGLVGSRILQLFNENFEIIAPTHFEFDVTDASFTLQNVGIIKPDQILYAAGFTAVDKAEEQSAESLQLNSMAVLWLTTACKKLDIPFHYLSTDYVFDGKKEDAAYKEDDLAQPVEQVYAISKRLGEEITLSADSRNSVLRLIMPYSAHFDKKLDLARLTISKLKAGESMNGVIDQNINPIFVDDLVYAIDKILQNHASGIYHLGATDYTTPYDYLKKIAVIFELNQELIKPWKFTDFAPTRPAKRPQHSWLDTTKFRSDFGSDIIHTIDEGLKLFKTQYLSAPLSTD